MKISLVLSMTPQRDNYNVSKAIVWKKAHMQSFDESTLRLFAESQLAAAAKNGDATLSG